MTSSVTSSCSGEPWIDGDDVYWLEGRPAEGGRRVLVRAAADGSTADLTPPPFNVRTRAHEYGGGSYVVDGGIVVFSNFADGRLYRLDPGATEAVPITPPGPWRYADLRPDLARRRFYAVREDHSAGEGDHEAVVNTIVAVPLDGGDPAVLVAGPDFVASPRQAPDGARLCWLEWDHPDMPWDATRLRVARHRARRLARRVDAGRGRAGRVDRPARVGTGRDAPPDQRPERLVEPVSDRRGPAARAAGADGRRVRRPVLDLRSIVVRVPRRRLHRGGGPSGRVATASSTLPGDGRDRRARDPVHRARCAADRVVRPGRPGRRPDRSRRGRALRPGDPGRVRRPAPGEHGDARPRDDLAPRADRVPDRGRADRVRALLPTDQPGVHGSGR